MKFLHKNTPKKFPYLYEAQDIGNMMAVIHVGESVCNYVHHCVTALEKDKTFIPSAQEKREFITAANDILAHMTTAMIFYKTAFKKIAEDNLVTPIDRQKHKLHSTEATKALMELHETAVEWNRLYSTSIQEHNSQSPSVVTMASPLPLISVIFEAGISLQKGKPAFTSHTIAEEKRKNWRSYSGNAL